jgi:CheY-like chemotaxis protein
MQDRMTGSSWRRSSDTPATPDALRVDETSASVSPEVPRILIVDNDMRAADVLELMLHAAGYTETRVAYSAHAALALAVGFHPDVAFLEMSLLDMESCELAQRLRERARDLRLVAMASGRQHDGRDLARNAGFERYLLKPIAAADLSKLLDVHPGPGAISQG